MGKGREGKLERMTRWGVFCAVLLVAAGAVEVEQDEYYDESVPSEGDTAFLSKLQNLTTTSRGILSMTLKQEIINLLYDAAREGNGTVAVMEISADDIHLPQNASDTAQLYGIPELVHDYLRSINVVPFVRRSANAQRPRDKYDYTYKLMASWMPPNGPEASTASAPASGTDVSRRRRHTKAALSQNTEPQTALTPTDPTH